MNPGKPFTTFLYFWNIFLFISQQLEIEQRNI